MTRVRMRSGPEACILHPVDIFTRLCMQCPRGEDGPAHLCSANQRYVGRPAASPTFNPQPKCLHALEIQLAYIATKSGSAALYSYEWTVFLGACVYPLPHTEKRT